MSETPEEIYERRIRECKAIADDPDASFDDREYNAEGYRLLMKHRDVQVGEVLMRIAAEIDAAIAT
jgi:hypothetical protein